MKSWKLALLLLRRPFATTVVSVCDYHIPEITDWSCFNVIEVDYRWTYVNDIKISHKPSMS